MASKLELAVPAELHQPDVGSPPLTRLQAWRLYALHFLFTWNAHTYESAAILFTAAAYPGTLTATSIRGVSVALASVCFSATLGAWIDRSPSRLRSLSCSIGAHRCTSLAAYAVWLYILDDPITLDHLRQLWRPFDLIQPDAAERTIKQALFGPLLLLGSLEALSSVANRISIDKEWLPALAPSSAVRTGGYDLAQLNAVHRRIDLACRLLTPLVVTFLMSMIRSYRLCIVLIATWSLLSWTAELWLARKVYNSHRSLRDAKIHRHSPAVPNRRPMMSDAKMSTTQMAPRPRSLLHRAGLATHAQTSGLQVYFSSVAWIPSITRALLHLTVLAYSTSFITYLLDSGYSVTLVTFASSTGSAMDLGGTVLAPSIVHFFSARRRAQSEKTRASMHEVDASRSRPTKDTSTLERLGLIGISWQFFSLIPVTAILFQLRPISNASHAVLWTHHGPVPLVMPLFAFLLLSRMGYWAFDLTSAELTQVLAPAGTRAVYGGVEEAFRSLFQLSYWILTTVFGNPHYFQWLALGSLGSVGVAALAYAFWVMDREGERTFGEDLE